MFDLDRFIVDCRSALTELSPELAIKHMLERAVSSPREVEAALGTPHQGEIKALYHSPDLTIMNVVSDQRESACSIVSSPGGESGGSGKRRSSSRAMQCVSQ